MENHIESGGGSDRTKLEQGAEFISVEKVPNFRITEMDEFPTVS